MISPNGIEYPLAPSNIIAPTTASGKIIGDATDLGNGIDKLQLRIDDLSVITGLSTTVGLDSPVTASSETNTSLSNVTINYEGEPGDIKTLANADSSFTTISTSNLNSLGFKGKTSLSYFNAASTSSKFVFRDNSDSAEQNDMVITYHAGFDEYTFVLPWQTSFQINTLDSDIDFKQYAYGEFSITSATALTTSNILLRTETGAFIDNYHITVTNTSGTTYKVVFWTYAVTVGALIYVFIGSAPTLYDIADYSVRVKASFDLATQTNTTTATYKSMASYVYDDYLTGAGYKDNTKVKLFASNTDDHPYSIFDITASQKIVLESYTKDNIAYERA